MQQILTNPDVMVRPVVIDSTGVQNENTDTDNRVNDGSSTNTIRQSATESVTTTTNNM